MSGSRVLVRLSLLLSLLVAIIQISGCKGVVGEDVPKPGCSGTSACAQPVITFSAAPSSVTPGAAATLTWSITGATAASIDGIGTIQTTGSMQVTPATTTTYTLHASGAGGSAQATATVNVNTLTFTATPTQILAGDPVTLSWSAQNETAVSIDNNVGSFGPTGTTVVHPTVTTSYTATATGPGGTESAAAKVIVGTVAIEQFTASPATVAPSGTAVLTWNVKGADTVSIDNGVGTVALSGNANVNPSATTTYTLTATHAGQTVTATATVTVSTAVMIQFTAKPNNISAGQSATLSWTTGNAQSVTIDNGVGVQPANGSVTVTPAATTTYTATATGTTGSASATAAVNVTPLPPPQAPIAGMFRYKFDLAGTGANLNESTLNLTTVNQNSFGRLRKQTLDGVIFTQPLYVANLNIAGGTHNVLYLGTEHDIVYAIDADGGQILWKRDFTDPANGITYLTNTNDGKGRTGLGPTVGITGTPVIDPNTRTLYVSAMTMENNVAKHHLHALDLITGAEKFGGPTEITGVVNGTGIGNDGNGHIPFDAEAQNQRAGLQLVNGVVYVPFASYSDVEPYHGWMFAIDATTMQILAYLNVTPSTEGGGMWQGGSAPVADADGNVYVQTADGEFTMNTGGQDIGDSTLKLHLNGNSLDIVDWFTPFNQDCLNTGDLDYGASGSILIPDQTGALPHLMVTGSKEGRIYLLNRDNLGHFSATGSNPQIPQDILINPLPCGQTSNDTTYRMYGTGTFWNNTVYLGSVFSGVRSFKLDNAKLSQIDMTSTIMQGNGQQGRGVIPVISANGNAQGILWFVEYGLDHNIIMHAYDATDLSREIYNTNQNATRDALGFGGVFVVPTVINGKVFVISSNNLNVYGILK